MKNEQYIGTWIRRFLLEYVVNTKNLSRNTQLSYRDTIRLLMTFAVKELKKSADKIQVEEMTPVIIKAFLTNLQTDRNYSLSTYNQKLYAIHALAKYIGNNDSCLIEWCRTVRDVPPKKAIHSLITYLEKDEIDEMLRLPDKQTAQGYRDYVLLLTLYNTGARVDEIAQMKVEDLSIPRNVKQDLSTVLIYRKGRKFRRTPLWKHTAIELKNITQTKSKTDSVFSNRLGESLTRFGIYNIVAKYAKIAANKCPAMLGKRISPHTIRHTTATHLLQAGVDINTIRAWLGHVSINTTNIYAEINLEMKAKALACCEINTDTKQKNGERIKI